MVVIAETTHLRRADTKTADSEEMLPVYVAEPGKKEGDTNIVVCDRYLGSQGQRVAGGAASVDVEKAQALSIISDMKPENKLAIIAWNTQSYELNRSPIFRRRSVIWTK